MEYTVKKRVKSYLDKQLERIIEKYNFGIICIGDSIYVCPHCLERVASRFHEDPSFMKEVRVNVPGSLYGRFLDMSYFVKCPNCNDYFLSHAIDSYSTEMGFSLYFLGDQEVLRKLWMSQF